MQQDNSEKAVFVIVHKLPHGLWSQEDLRPTVESARHRMHELRSAAPNDTCAWDVWDWAQWEQMRNARLTMESFDEHAAPSVQPPPPVPANELAVALGLLPDDRTMHAVAAAIGDLREVSAWYGALPDAFLASFVTSHLLGCVHMLGTYDEAAFLEVARAAWSRYHTAASNYRRQQETRTDEG